MERIPKQVVDDLFLLKLHIKTANEIGLEDMIAHDKKEDGSKGKTAFERLKEALHDKIIRVVDDKYIDVNFHSICATIEYIGDYAGCDLVTSSIEYYPEEC